MTLDSHIAAGDDGMSGITERVISTSPFVVRRRVRWSDCDPAGVVYTGVFTDYLMDAVGHFYDHLGYGPNRTGANADNVGLPTRSHSLNFHVTLYPNDIFDLQITVREIRTHTFELAIAARVPDGRIAFDGHLAGICVFTDRREIAPVPDGLRDSLAAHQETQKETQ